MKFTLLSAMVVACCTTFVRAGPCASGFQYCGYYLQQYHDKAAVDQATLAAGLPLSASTFSLFLCLNDGHLKYIKTCEPHKVVSFGMWKAATDRLYYLFLYRVGFSCDKSGPASLSVRPIFVCTLKEGLNIQASKSEFTSATKIDASGHVLPDQILMGVSPDWEKAIFKGDTS
ncbi:hypothetical protein FB451DRAFT_1168689 [Mycena latifolia]|nr:hypothetical protein FB451DRAFT_1168689 [Mycena latifolia]